MKIHGPKIVSIILVFILSITNLMAAGNDAMTRKPLVLIHAFPADHRLWQAQLDALSNKFEILAIDLTGFGKGKSTQGQAITMTQYADEIHVALQEHHLSSAIIAGESMGGYVALAFLKKYPKEVDGLILTSTQTIADTDEQKQKREKLAQDVLANGTQNFVNTFVNKAVSQYASPEIKAFLLNIFSDQSATGIASALRGMAMREDTSLVLTQTSVPILIIAGSEDAVIPPVQSQHMHDLNQHSQLFILSDTGHLVNVEKPKDWNELVLKTFA